MASPSGSSGTSQEQLNIAKSMLTITQQMAAAIDNVNKKQMEQVQIMNQIHDSMKSLDTQSLVTSLDRVVKAINDLTQKFENMGKTSQQALNDMSTEAAEASDSVDALSVSVTEAGKSAVAATSSTKDLTKAVKANREETLTLSEKWKEFTEDLKTKFPRAALFASGALDGLKAGIGAIGAAFKLAKGIISTAVDSILEIGKAVVSIPFEFLDMFTEKANELAGQTSDWFDALQEIKREYGNLEQTSSKAIVSMAKNTTALNQAGISSFKIFGTSAEAARTFLEMSKGMGATFGKFATEMEAAGQAFPAIQMGLGLTAEDMRAIGNSAIAAGEDFNTAITRFHKQSHAMSKAFGVDSKLIARDMAKATADVKNFGGTTTKQIGIAATYARKLGVELDKITNTLGAFETFEGAAENASKLSQAFGVNIDAFKMMEAQDPATQVDMLRKSFAAAGKDAEKMNRQELSLLATSVGMDEATAKQVFSLKNQGVALDQISQKSDEAEKRQVDQITVLKELKNALVEMQKPVSKSGGFFKQFTDGITQGFERTSEFRGLLKNMGGSLRVFREEGRRLGKIIMDLFPGIKQMFGGMKDLFQPQKFRKLVGGIVDEIKVFFQEVGTGKFSFSELMKKIKTKFFDFFNSNGTAGKSVIDGFKSFTKAVTGIIGGMIRWASDMVKEGIISMVDLITGKKKLSSGGTGSFLADAFEPIMEAFSYAWTNLKPVLIDALKSLGDMIWTWAKDTLIPKLKDMAPMILGALFGAAAIKGVLTVAMAQIGKTFSGGLAGIFGGNREGGAAPAAPAAAGAAAEVSGAGAAAGAAAADAGAGASPEQASRVTTLTDIINGMMDRDKKSGWDASGAKKLGLKLVAIAGALAVGGVMMAGAIKLMAEILRGSKLKGVIESMVIMGGLIVAVGPLIGALMKTDASAGDILKKSLAVSLAIGALGVIGAAVSKLAAGVEFLDILKAALIVGGMTLAASKVSEFIEKTKDMEPGDVVKKAGALALGIGALGAVGTGITKLAGLVDFLDVGKAALIVGGMTLAASKVSEFIEKTKDMEPGDVLKKAGALALGVGALGAVGIAITYFTHLVTLEEVLKAVIIVGGMTLAASKLTEMLEKTEGVSFKDLIKVMGGLALGIAALGAVGIGIAYFTHLITLEEVLKAAIIVGGMSFVALQLMEGFSKLQGVSIDLGGILKIILAVGIMIIALGAIGIGLAWLASEASIPEATFKSVGEFLKSLAMTFLILVPVLLASVVIGAVAAFAGPLIVVGMAALTAALGVLALAAIGIMETLDKTELGSDIGPKVDAFTKVLGGISAMVDSIANIMEIMAPGLSDLISGTTFTDKINAASSFIDKLLGEKGGNGIIGIVEVVVAAIKEMNVQGMEGAAQVFSNSLTAVGAIAKALTPPPEFFAATESLFGPNTLKLTEAVNAMADKMAINIKEILQKTMGHVQEILRGPLPTEEQAKGLASIMAALGPLLSSLAPNPELIKAFQTKDDGDETELDIDDVIAFLDAYLPKMEKLLPTITGSVINGIITSIQNISIEQLSKLGSIGEILKAVGDLVKVINEGAKGPTVKIDSGAVGNVINVTSNTPAITEVLKNIGPTFGTLVDGVKRVADTMPTGKAGASFDKQVKTVVSLFSLLKAVPELANAVKVLDEVKDKDGKVVGTQKFDFGATIVRLTDVFRNMVVGESGGYLPGLMKGVKEVYGFLTKDRGAPLTKVATTVTKFFEDLKKLSEAMKGLLDFGIAYSFSPAMKVIFMKSIEGAMEIITEVLGPKVQQYLPHIKERIESWSSAIGPMPKMTKMVQKITEYTASLHKVKDAVKEIEGVKPDSTSTTVSSSLSSLATSLSFVSKENTGPENGLSQLTTALGNVNKGALDTAKTDLGSLVGQLNDLQKTFDKVKVTFDKEAVGGTFAAINAMVAGINQLNDALSPEKLGTLNIKTRLKALAENMGVGGTNDLVVKNKQLQINLEVRVEMLASELERAILIRKSSVIRDYINLLAGGEKGGKDVKAASAIPYEGSPPPFPAPMAGGAAREYGLYATPAGAD